MFTTVQKSMMTWTFALAVLLGTVCGAFMLQPPTTPRRADPKTAGPAALKNPRTPASDPVKYAAMSLDNQNHSQAVELTLDCKGPQTSLFTSGVKQVRLSGTSCKHKREFASTEIRNEANGFSATVFFPNARTFTTDYISLAPGQNRLRIAHVFKAGGREERVYMIDRQKE